MERTTMKPLPTLAGAARAAAVLSLTLVLAAAAPGQVAGQPDDAPTGAAPAADGDPAEDASSSRSAAFRAVEGPAQDNVPGGALMIAAYAVVWLLVFGYLVRLARLQSKNTADLDRLLRAVGRARGGEGG